MSALRARLFIVLQHVLPRYALTAAVYRLARIRAAWFKNALIRGFIRLYKVDVGEIAGEVPNDFSCFNDFFTRELNNGARPIDGARRSLIAPVDGTVSAAGGIEDNRLLQAKGCGYTLEELLASDVDDARLYHDGTFITIYLAPHNYHRVHAPWSGTLTAARYVPGDLYSVNDATVQRMPKLFARNERLVCHFTTDAGPMILVLVGALNVGSITTPWTGELRPRRRGVVEELDVQRSNHDRQVATGDLVGWFNMGSTVVMLMPPGACTLRDGLGGGTEVVMGQAVAALKGLSL